MSATTIDVFVTSPPVVDVTIVSDPVFEVLGVLPTGPRGPVGPTGATGATGAVGATGAAGAAGADGADGVVQSVVAGDNVTVDATDPANPIVSADAGGGSGVVETIVPGSNVDVDATDPANPVVSMEALVEADIPATIARDSEVTSAVSAEATARDTAIETHRADTTDVHGFADAAAVETKVGHLTVTQAVDLDTIEARVNSLDAAVVLRGNWDASAGTFPGGGTAQAGDSYIVTVAGTVNAVAFAVGDRIVSIVDNASTGTYAANWLKLDYTDAVLSVDGATGAVSLAATYQASSAALTTLAGAGNSAVLAATTASFLTADETKLDGIETGAEVNDSAAEILTKILTVDGAGSGLDADLLDGLSSAAFETPAGAQAKADAKVTQTITNGTTGTAPSEDAVFDALALKAPLASPALTGTPTVPTAAQGTNTTQAASTEYVQTEAGLLVPKSLFDANTMLYATTDNTPAALTVGVSTFVGRKATGDISAMSVAEAGTLIGTYVAYVPTFAQSAALSTSSLTARYNLVGKRVHAWGRAVFSSAGTTNNRLSMTLPVNCHATLADLDNSFGTGWVIDSSTISMPALVVGNGAGASSACFVKTNGDVLNYIGVVPNFAVASGDYVTWDITYEAA